MYFPSPRPLLKMWELAEISATSKSCVSNARKELFRIKRKEIYIAPH